MFRIYLLIIILSSFWLNVCGQVLQKTDVIGKWTVISIKPTSYKFKPNEEIKLSDFKDCKFDFFENETCRLFLPNKEGIKEYFANWDITKMHWVVILSHNPKEYSTLREIEMLLSFKLIKSGNKTFFKSMNLPLILEVKREL